MALAFDKKLNSAGSTTMTMPLDLDLTAKVLVVTIVADANNANRAGGAPTWNTTESLTSAAAIVAGSAECQTELWYLLSPTTSYHSVSVPNTGSDAINVIASSYKGATAAVLDQSTSTAVSAANPLLTLNNVPDGSVVVDILGSGYKDAPTGNTGGTLLYGIDNTAWNDAGQYNMLGFDFYETNTASFSFVSSAGATAVAQSFTGITGALNSCLFYIKKQNTPTGSVYAKLYDHSGTFGSTSVPTGAALATSDAFDISTLDGTNAKWIQFNFSTPYTLSAATKYCIAIEFTGGDGTNRLQVGYEGAGTHGGNFSSYSGSWAATAAADVDFAVFSNGKTYNITLSYTQFSDDVAYIMASFKENISCTLSGTITSATEEDIVAGGKTIILTLTGDTWVPTFGQDNAITTAFIQGIDSGGSEANGWDAVVKANMIYSDLTTTSTTAVTITLGAEATYDITATETITVTVTGSAVNLGSNIIASPTFNITPVGGTALGMMSTRASFWGDI